MVDYNKIGIFETYCEVTGCDELAINYDKDEMPKCKKHLVIKVDVIKKNYLIKIDGCASEYYDTWDEVLEKIKDLNEVTEFRVTKIYYRNK